MFREVAGLEKVGVNSVHYCSLFDDDVAKLVVKILQVSHLSYDFGYLSVPMLVNSQEFLVLR